MRLEDMSTKDLERLYYKHFGKVKASYTLSDDKPNEPPSHRHLGEEKIQEVFGFGENPQHELVRDRNLPSPKKIGNLLNTAVQVITQAASKKALDSLSTKDLRILYLKSLRMKYKSNEGYTPKMQEEDNDRYKMDVNELQKKTENHAKLGDDVYGNRSVDPFPLKEGKIAYDANYEGRREGYIEPPEEFRR